MGDLPEDRVLTHAPFTAAGIDVFGPFETKVNRKTTKKWAILSTCFSTRAVCILPLRSLDSASVVRALMKMNAMFPGVKKLYSDNGSNFRGADREMREALMKWKEENVNAELQPQGIEWVFGPARCGSAGGVWERMIGLTKNLLKSVIKGQILDAGTWETYLFATMAIQRQRETMTGWYCRQHISSIHTYSLTPPLPLCPPLQKPRRYCAIGGKRLAKSSTNSRNVGHTPI